MDIQQNNVAILHFNLVNQDGSTIFIRKTKLATFNLINPSAVSVPITDIGFDATLNQCWVRIPKASNATTGQYYGVLNIVDDDWGTYTTSKIKVYSVVSDADEDTKSVVFTVTCIATQITNPSGGNSPYYNTTTSTWWQYSDTLKAFEDTGVGNPIQYNLRYNVNVDAMRIDGTRIYIKPSGFGIFYNSKIYYIADTTNARVNDYEFDMATIPYAYLVLDETKLLLENARNELSDVIKIVQGDIKSTSIILAVSDTQTGKVRFVGQFADYFAKYATQEYVDSSGITNSNMNLKAFEPEFSAYKRGRINDVNGVGTGWYERFRMIHISDTHQYNTLFLEALKVAQTKVHVIANTGDDGNGSVSTPTATSLTWMQNVKAIITPNNSLPYLAVKGNHDICNITKEQWRNNIGNLIQEHANIQWGSSTGAYGYYDITPNANVGKFRIIMLDPFDYPDGDFPNTRAFQTATFSQAQIDWLISSLLDAAANNSHVITMMHYSFGDNSLNFNEDKAKPDALFYQDAFMIPDIIDAIQNKGTLNRTYPDSVGTQNIIINKNFSTAGDLDYVCHLFGHIHSKNDYWCQKTDGSKMYDILMLGESALGTYGNALNKVYRESGTINEIEFSAIEIDTIEKTIYRVSYGAFLKYDKTNNMSERTKKISYRRN